MAPASDPRLLVLLGLRLKGAADPEALAEHADLDVGEIERQLVALSDEGLVVERGVAPKGWALTRAGRHAAAHAVTAEVEATGARPAVTAAYERFRALNAAALETCSRWQVREVEGRAVLNDHADPDYDNDVVGDLSRLQHEADPVLHDLAATLDRFSTYAPRLRRAVRKVEAGEADWFTKPTLPSYHTVWFELHEDLLATLGIERSAEVVR